MSPEFLIWSSGIQEFRAWSHSLGQERALPMLALLKAMFARSLDLHGTQLGECHDIFTSQALKAVAPALLHSPDHLAPYTPHPACVLFNLSAEPEASF